MGLVELNLCIEPFQARTSTMLYFLSQSIIVLLALMMFGTHGVNGITARNNGCPAEAMAFARFSTETHI